MLAYLPSADDMTWVGKPLGLLGRLIDDRRDLWRPVMGIGLTVICWTLNNKRLNRLHRTDGVHTLIDLVQMAFVCLFLYFAIADPMLAGGESSRALQCASLALAGVTGEWAWAHARRYGLVDARGAAQAARRDWSQRPDRKSSTAVLNMPLAWVGTITWTLGWFLIPLVIMQILPDRPSQPHADLTGRAGPHPDFAPVLGHARSPLRRDGVGQRVAPPSRARTQTRALGGETTSISGWCRMEGHSPVPRGPAASGKGKASADAESSPRAPPLVGEPKSTLAGRTARPIAICRAPSARPRHSDGTRSTTSAF